MRVSRVCWNRLSGHDAAIVTDIPGTTRDVLRERININGIPVEFVDTAGLRDEPDAIEAEGIRRARAALANADAALIVDDASDPPPLDGSEVPDGIAVLRVLNKTDLTGDPAGKSPAGDLRLSAKTGAGIDALLDAIAVLAGADDAGEGTFTARRRHIEALNRAAQHFAAGVAALEENRAGEILAEELKAALDAVGEITGTFSNEDLLGRIFSEFCIGK